jgi:hypothetical protein
MISVKDTIQAIEKGIAMRNSTDSAITEIGSNILIPSGEDITTSEPHLESNALHPLSENATNRERKTVTFADEEGAPLSTDYFYRRTESATSLGQDSSDEYAYIDDESFVYVKPRSNTSSISFFKVLLPTAFVLMMLFSVGIYSTIKAPEPVTK